MIVRLALRSLLSRPLRSAVLAGGFGLGVSVMASLLGVGEVILEQASSPSLQGGGDIIIAGATGKVSSARFIISSAMASPPLEGRVEAASPTSRAMVYLRRDGRVVRIRAQGGIPSLERMLEDAETAGIDSWTDAPGDAAWASPDHASVLRAMDRFHPIPDVPAREDSWAEWMYFKGSAGRTSFYLTFMVGPRVASGKRIVGVRLQLQRDGDVASYADALEIDEEELLATAPELSIGDTRVRLEGLRYHIDIDLPETPRGAPQAGLGVPRGSRGSNVRGRIVIEGIPGRSLPPITIHGARGWRSGYVIPVMSGRLDAVLSVDGERIVLESETAYHDHNWGHWEDVSWRWGHVQSGGLSFVYGRVFPPADAADADRMTGFLAAYGPNGPLGYSTSVSIEETDEGEAGGPQRIRVRGRSESLELTMEIEVRNAITTRVARDTVGSARDFFQLRAMYRVTGHAGGESIDFTAPGAAETFRGPRIDDPLPR